MFSYVSYMSKYVCTVCKYRNAIHGYRIHTYLVISISTKVRLQEMYFMCNHFRYTL